MEMVEITSNYKDSPLGKIPSDWEVKRISEFGRVFTGNTPPTDEIENYGDDYLFVSPGDLSENKYIEKTEKRLSKRGFDISRKFPKGSILFTCIGSTIGKSGIATEDLTSNQQINAIVANEQHYNEFLYYQLERNLDKIRLLAGEQAVPIINKSQFEAIRLLCAPLPEQRAIAQLLSTWDNAITKTQSLITQKEQRKKWLMQQLLTGKKRLKGFDKEWKEVKLGDITKNFSRRNKDLSDARIYSVTNTNGFVFQSDHFSREVAGDDLTNYKVIRKNEFAYNPARINVGSIAYFNYDIGVISSLYVCFSTTNEILDYFLEQVFKLNHTKFKIGSYGEGGVRIYLWYDLFAKIRIDIPTIKEQTAIAQVLQTADKEIQLLKTKMEKLKEQKKGLMQILLTGKKRLKQNLQNF